MQKTFLLISIFALVVGCARGVPVRNPQIKESSIPTRYCIEGIKPIKGDRVKGDQGWIYWTTCVEMVLNFYAKPFEKETIDKAIARVRAAGITAAAIGPSLGSLGAIETIETGVRTIVDSKSPALYYPTALDLHGFKRHFFYDQSPNGVRIKFFLAQRHPVIVSWPIVQSADQASWQELSYVLLIGYDDEKEIFLVCNPKSGEAFEMPYRDFPRRQAFEWVDTSKLVRSGEIIYPEKYEASQNQFAASKTSSSDNINLTAESRPPISKKPQVAAPTTSAPTLSPSTAIKQCSTPIWNIGDSWKFEDREIKVIRVEGDLYIAENSSSSDLVAYDNNTLEETFSIDDKGGRVKMKSTFPIYFDFPLYVGKKWKRLFSARPSFLNRDYDYLMEYKVLCIEDITVSAGTFKAFKVEINHTNNESKGSGKAHIWYSPKVKLFVKVALDDSSYWRNSQGRELMSFNLKDKETSPEEIKLPIEKVDIAPQVQPTLVEKQKVAPPIVPSLSTHEQGVDIPSKSQPPVTGKKKVPAFAAPPQSTDFVVVTGTFANIRTGAGNEFPIVTTVNQGAKLTLLGEYGKWFNVRLENGQEGWINSRFVQE
jgi:hypothetical protein